MRTRLRMTETLETAGDLDFEPPPEPAWQEEVTRRLGRIAATMIFVIGTIVALLVPHMRLTIFIAVPVSVGLMAAAGWARFLPGNVARACLIGGFLTR